MEPVWYQPLPARRPQSACPHEQHPQHVIPARVCRDNHMGKFYRQPPLHLSTHLTASRTTVPRATTLAMYGPSHPTHQSNTVFPKPTTRTTPGSPSSNRSSAPTRMAAAWPHHPMPLQSEQCGTKRFSNLPPAAARPNLTAGPQVPTPSAGPSCYPPAHPG